MMILRRIEMLGGNAVDCIIDTRVITTATMIAFDYDLGRAITTVTETGEIIAEINGQYQHYTIDARGVETHVTNYDLLRDVPAFIHTHLD